MEPVLDLIPNHLCLRWDKWLEKMLILRPLLIITLIVVMLPDAGNAISVSQTLDKSTMSFEDSASFEIVIEWSGPQNANIFGRPLNPFFDRLKVGRFSSSISSIGRGYDEVTTKKFKYVLIPTSSGAGKIDPITISYVGMPDSIPGELVTEPMTITIAQALPQEVPGEGNNSLYLVLFGALILVGSSVALYIWRSGRETEVVKTPKEQFLEGLDDLKKRSGQDFKLFQSGLCELLESYLESAHDVKARSITDEDLTERINALDLSEQQKIDLSGWLSNARRDKFRPVTAAPGEAIRLENEIREFFARL